MMTLLWSVAVPSWVPDLVTVALMLASLFLMLLVLIQSGKGGGLSGALGGAGGSSAFGSRAGDTFTRITIYTAAVWVLLIMFLIKMTQDRTALPERGTSAQERPEGEG